MNRAFWWIASLSANAAYASLTVGYADGTQVLIDTASTGGNTAQIYQNGVVHASQGTFWHRVVSDKDGKVVFAYDLEAGRGSAAGTFVIRIKPVDPAYAHEIQKGPVATVTAVREFNAVRAGQSVAIDILSNPATGDKIFDVLQPSQSGEPPRVGGEEFNFQNLEVWLNGHALPDLAGVSMTGAGAIVYIPGHGAYFVSLESRPHFQPAGHVERDRLWFDVDDDHVEIRSKGRLLAGSESRTVWVKHDPLFLPISEQERGNAAALDAKLAAARAELASLRKQYRDSYPLIRQIQSQIQTLEQQRTYFSGSAAYIGTADNVDWLMPKKD